MDISIKLVRSGEMRGRGGPRGRREEYFFPQFAVLAEIYNCDFRDLDPAPAPRPSVDDRTGPGTDRQTQARASGGFPA